MNSKTILKNNRAAGLIILTIDLLLTGQMITGHEIVGADSVFHYNRFYETYSQLKHLNFSWFQSIYGFNQSGQIVNVVYGPLFAYLNGGLLLLTHSWYQYQIVSSIIIYLIGGFGMYRLLKLLSIRSIIAAMMASFYLTVGWMPRWQIGNNTTAMGAMLMPYLLMITFDMITDANRPIRWKKLTLLMILTIEIHLLSALLFMLVLIPAWLYAVNHHRPLLQKGHSLHHIYVNCLDLTMTSERTLYSYVNQGLLSARNIDMPRTVRMRPRKNKKRNLKVDKACRIGRTWEEFQSYLQEHPNAVIRQLDSVEGVRGGKVLLTIHFVQQELQLAFLWDAIDSQSVIDIFEKIYLELRPDAFIRLFPILLADNGSEFSNPKAIEFDKQGNQRTQMYYCDPSAPFQRVPAKTTMK